MQTSSFNSKLLLGYHGGDLYLRLLTRPNEGAYVCEHRRFDLKNTSAVDLFLVRMGLGADWNQGGRARACVVSFNDGSTHTNTQ